MRLERSCAVFACSLALAGCGIYSGTKSALTEMLGTPPVKSLGLVATSPANGGYPVAVDVVFVYDQGAWEALPKLKAGEWFTGRSDMKSRYATQLDVLSWELVPGQRVDNVELPPRLRAAVGAVVFADYNGPGAYRAVLQSRSKVLVHLNASDFDVRDVTAEGELL